MLDKLLDWFREIGRDPILAKAQALQMRRQVPLLYSLLLINSTSIAWSQFGLAPLALTVSVPALLFGATISRLIYWMRARHKPPPTPEEAKRQLRTVTCIGGLSSIAYLIWALLLLQYGDAIDQAHVALYVSTTVLACIFCLFQLPQAAVVVSACVLPGFLVALIIQDHFIFSPLAMNVALVVLVLLRVLFNSFESFRTEVAAREKLAQQRDEMVRLNSENHALAHTDSLTQLPNRRRFLEDLSAMAVDPSCLGGGVVGVIDLDRFKSVNDTFGHHLGDQLLKQVSHRLRQSAGPYATLYRLGGDEFGILIYLPLAQAEQFAERACEEIAKPIQLDDREISIGVSFGLAPYIDAGVQPRDLWERADQALYHAKRHQPGTVFTYTQDLEFLVRGEQQIEVELRSLNTDEDLDVRVQPVSDSTSGVILGGEVLVRWTSARLGPIPPQRFITIAERSSVIHRITLTVVKRALGILAQLPDHLSLAVNISASDLNSPDTIERVLSAVRDSGIDPSRLWFEVTETAVMHDVDAAIEALRMLRTAGMKIALDDFGTGYSSLSNLHRIPLDRVKIDQSFATDLQDNYSNSIALAVVNLCRTLGLSCVAEGVETPEQAAIFQSMGCEILQGYYISEPLPVSRFMEMLAEHDCTAFAVPALLEQVKARALKK
ncbi:putative bifunctional diguanylate cyclase/phosphodiesterase [Altericroceibacterium endophyticum]|uniref:EAL domain-containing protein n=1 Tax=Altericroceibacterium endophyticum TaxID=1808508 RepID=A0A6I4T9S7_9SPHN|nr:EAL domain-containing protein [Altericroceibacterium endophyticum]MXO67119.1 EAL domain-containing protein [Altericroceibacterium endophyticum]